MDKRSASIVAGMLVAALMAGIVSRDVMLRPPTPVQVTVQTPAGGLATGAGFTEPVERG